MAVSRHVSAIADDVGKALCTEHSRYYKVDEIARGNYSRVTLYRDAEKNPIAAKGWLRIMMERKTVPKFNENGADLVPLSEQVEKEVRILQLLNSEHFPRLREIIDDPDYKRLLVLLEYVHPIFCWDEQRQQYIPQNEDNVDKSPGVLTPDAALTFTRQILSACTYLHSHQIVHNDIKPENCGLSSSLPSDAVIAPDATNFPNVVNLPAAKLFDFSSATEELMVYGAESTVDFMPPEAFQPNPPTWGPGRDFWATGMLLFALLFGVSAYEGSNSFVRQLDIMAHKWRIPSSGAARIEKHKAGVVLRGLLHEDPHARGKAFEMESGG